VPDDEDVEQEWHAQLLATADPPAGVGRVVIRPVTIDDVDQLGALYDGLDTDDRRCRFFGGRRPRREFLERMATAGDRGGGGVVAVVLDEHDNERQLVGEAGFSVLPNGNGELAITVTPDRRSWLGPYLLDALAEAAAACGVENLEADVLTTDRAMLAMLRSRGSVNIEHTGWSVVRLLIGTSTSMPSWPERDDRPRVLVEGFAGRWHAETEARAAGLQVLTCSGPGAGSCPALVGEPCSLAAGADVIVVAHRRPDDSWQQLLQSQASVHPGVPVCLEPPPTDDANGRPAPACPVVADSGVVSFVGQLQNPVST
jgi:hypothetical protein